MSNRRFILKYTVANIDGSIERVQWYNTGIGMSSPDFARARVMTTHELTETLRYMSPPNRYTNIRIREVTNV